MDAILSVLIVFGIIVSVLRKAAKNASQQTRANAQRMRAQRTEQETLETLKAEAGKASVQENVRQESAAAKPVQPVIRSAISAKDLKRAVIMNEILGKPVSMRER